LGSDYGGGFAGAAFDFSFADFIVILEAISNIFRSLIGD